MQRHLLICVALLGFWTMSARALVSNLVLLPATTTVGASTSGKATDAGNDPIQSVLWEYQYKNAPWISNWTTFGNSGNGMTSDALPLPFPGTYTIRMTTTYKKVGPPQPPAPTVLTATCTATGADGFNVTSGLGTDVSNNASIVVTYQITSGGTVVGASVGGTAQELITNKSDYKGNKYQDDTAWTLVGPNMQFYRDAMWIYDAKGSNLTQADWDAIPVNTVYFKMTQNNLLIFQDGGGFLIVEGLGAVNLQRRKTSTTTWLLEKQ